ncbi:MAG: collagen-like protein [Candidatus Aerophobetes bacterium]|nr:collagen-like protein [Candidatus Aerophobetes bacterium]
MAIRRNKNIKSSSNDYDSIELKYDILDIDIFGVYTDLINYNSRQRGFSFFSRDTATLYYKASEVLGDWKVIDLSEGLQGDTGLQGLQGLKGDTGPQGLKGDTGPQGPVSINSFSKNNDTLTYLDENSNNIIIDLFPSQTDKAKQFLITDGSKTSWSKDLSVNSIEIEESGFTTFDSASILNLSAPDGVRIQKGVFGITKMAQEEINTVIPENGDQVYNITINKFQGYQNGVWINMDGTVNE